MKERLFSPKTLALLFVLYGLIGALIVLLKLPPFMGADEPNHLRRANLLAQGQLIGHRLEVGGTLTTGGIEESNLNDVEAIYAPMKFHPETKLRDVDAARGAQIPWGEATSDQSFENTAIYPPWFYLPSALAIAISKVLGLSIVRSLLVARLINAISCLVIGYFAIRISGRASIYLFGLLLLPMSLFLSETVTQDGLLLAASALACALLVRGLEESRPATSAELWGAAACLTLVGMGKPPYILFCLLLLIASSTPKKLKWLALCCSGVLTIGWHILIAAIAQTAIHRAGVNVDPGAQVSLLIHRPWELVMVILNTVRHQGSELLAQFLGELGWLDTPLPKFYYLLAIAAYAVSVAAIWIVSWKREGRRSIGAVLVLGATKLSTFAALYVAYTAVEATQVDGVQGRYFLPIAAFLPLVLIGKDSRELSPKAKIGWAIVMAFPLISLVVLERTLTQRYY